MAVHEVLRMQVPDSYHDRIVPRLDLCLLFSEIIMRNIDILAEQIGCL